MKKDDKTPIYTEEDLKENRKHVLVNTNSVEYDENDYESQVLTDEVNKNTIYLYILGIVIIILIILLIIMNI